MDRTRFDGITKALATGQSRRSILKLLGGGITAATATAVVGKSVSAQAGCYTEGTGPCPTYTCCDGLECVDGICVAAMADPVPDTTDDTGGEVAMPTTGSGPGGSDAAPMIGMALAGGAAALVASKYLRRSEPSQQDQS